MLSSKMYGGMAVEPHEEWSASRTGRFTPGGVLGTHSIGGWVGPRVGLEPVEDRKGLYCRQSNAGLRVRSLHYAH
jgi:hypothetical protein